MLLATALLIVASSSSVSTSAPAIDAPAIIDAPMVTSQVLAKKHNFNKLDLGIYGGVIAYRVGDYLTTERALSNGQHEIELPQSFVATKGGFAAYSLGMAGLEITSSVLLHKHGHAKLARIVDSISIGAGTATDIHNYMAPKINKK
jgi:hypothetical protein